MRAFLARWRRFQTRDDVAIDARFFHDVNGRARGGDDGRARVDDDRTTDPARDETAWWCDSFE